MSAVVMPALAGPIDPDRGPDSVAVVYPVHTSWTEAVRREAQHRAAVAAGLIPAKTALTEVPWHEPDVEREPGPADGIFFVPPAFSGQKMKNERENPQSIGTNFFVTDLTGARNWLPPDSNGAIGPNHFVSTLNNAICIHNRSGTLLSNVALESLFGGVPIGGAFDPRIIYDRRSGRWFITVLEFNGNVNNRLFLGVSSNSNPTGGWYYYALPVGLASTFNDFETLGTDDNGVYTGFTRFGGASAGPAIVALLKSAVLAAGAVGVYTFNGLSDMYSSPQPAHNLSAAGGAAKAWFAASSTTVYANVMLKSLTWSAGVPTLSATTTVASPGYNVHPNALALGTTTTIATNDDRIQMAMMRSDQLWVCRNIGTNASGTAGTDRCGSEWLQIDTSPAPTLVQSGRIYDPAASAPRMYYYPSLAISGQGHVAVGLSGSKATHYVSAYTCGRLATDALNTMQSLDLMKVGSDPYNHGSNRWGDYSYTSVDPNDDMTMWTIQEYATDVNQWGTWVAQLLAPPPLASDPNAHASQGAVNATINLTGSRFFDPGTGFANRISAALTGGSPNGISNVSARYNSPTSVTIYFDVAANAQASARNIVITNPDGQSITVIGGLTIDITKVASKLVVQNRTGNYTDTIALKANLYRSSDNALLVGRTVDFSIAGTAVGSATTDGGGLATLNWVITSGAASRTIGAAFAGDTFYLACTNTATLTSTTINTKVFVVDRLNVKIKKYTVLKAYLFTPANVPLPGKTLSVDVDGTAIGSAATNASGYVQFGYTVPEGSGAGNRVIHAAWAGNAGYNASANNGTLGVIKGDLYLWPYVRSGKRGTNHPLQAYVRSLPDYVIQPGKSITFKVNGTTIGSVAVAATGWATVIWAIPAGEPTGSHTCTAEFAGDAWYAAVSVNTTFNVVL